MNGEYQVPTTREYQYRYLNNLQPLDVNDMNRFFPKTQYTAYDAITEAQKIVFAPIIFQVARTVRDIGIMEVIEKSGDDGIGLEDIARNINIDAYGVSVLLDSCVSAGIVEIDSDEKYTLSKVGYFLLNDRMTRINMDYNHYVCYQGLYYLDESIKQGKPAGLRVFGKEWETLYEALPHLQDDVKNSWYAFDHFYSDSAYPQAAKILMNYKPSSVVDVGTNTGRFSIHLAQVDDSIQITMLDLPDQLKNACENVNSSGLANRIQAKAVNLLNENCDIPVGKDAYWLSQLLSCFSGDEIVQILKNIRSKIQKNSHVFILETCWDRQQHAAAAYSLINTSIYFTSIASGNSKMYHSRELISFIESAGFTVTDIHDSIGICHSLFVCSPTD